MKGKMRNVKLRNMYIMLQPH